MLSNAINNTLQHTQAQARVDSDKDQVNRDQAQLQDSQAKLEQDQLQLSRIKQAQATSPSINTSGQVVGKVINTQA